MRRRRLVMTCLVIVCVAVPFCSGVTASPSEPRFPDGFPPGFVPPTDPIKGPLTGFGGVGGGPVRHDPVVFIHGQSHNSGFGVHNAHDWDENYAYFLAHGYTGNELWALSWGANSDPAYPTARLNLWDSSNRQDIRNLALFIDEVVRYTRTINPRVSKVVLIAHSLGVTLVREYLKLYGTEKVAAAVLIAGANHGTGLCPTAYWPLFDADASQVDRFSYFACGADLYPDRSTNILAVPVVHPNPSLAAINQPSETPPGVRYLTIYDGTGDYDIAYFSHPPDPNSPSESERFAYQLYSMGLWAYDPSLPESPALAGATNIPLNAILGTALDHNQLRTDPRSMALQLVWARRHRVHGGDDDGGRSDVAWPPELPTALIEYVAEGNNLSTR